MQLKSKLLIIDLAVACCIAAAVLSGVLLWKRQRAREESEAGLDALRTVVMDAAGAGEPPGQRRAGEERAMPAGADGQKDGDGLSEEYDFFNQMRDRNKRLDGYSLLAAQNKDMAGWITVPGTRIDYPVMSSPDRPDYYLKHDFNKARSAYGVPYIDAACGTGEDCGNIMIYGHHMKDGSMFADLMNYTDREYYKKHRFFWFDTMEDAGLYEIVSVLRASALAGQDPVVELAYDRNEDGYSDYVEEVKKRSFYDTEVTADGGPLVTLITCEYTQKDGRLMIVAKKLESKGE